MSITRQEDLSHIRGTTMYFQGFVKKGGRDKDLSGDTLTFYISDYDTRNAVLTRSTGHADVTQNTDGTWTVILAGNLSHRSSLPDDLYWYDVFIEDGETGRTWNVGYGELELKPSPRG